ncbi:non-ribosomal peptide synthetase [Micromonospora sp. DT229]|uniref:non-ribosomal peptide synthetase n=1 Tax=Micromonospora sp. DT229 TaxID=3393430 RepID=UPI003CF1E568
MMPETESAGSAWSVLLHEHSKRRGDATAVRSGSTSLTYRELHALAGSYAVRLAELALPPGRPVAVDVGRGVDLPAAIVGTAIAGHVAVPLGRSDPSGSAFPVAATVSVTPAGPAAVATGIPTEEPVTPTDRPFIVVRTAGGRPVVLGHEQVDAMLTDLAAGLGVGPGDRSVAWTPADRAGAVAELLLPLRAGAELIVVDDDAADPADVVGLLTRWSPTLVMATATLWTILLEAGWPGAPQLRACVVGEPCPARLATRLAGIAASVWTGFGTAETAGWCTLRRVAPGESGALLGPPIGGLTLDALDAAGRPVGSGDVGSLRIGGHLVTDDLARRGPDGGLRYAGRARTTQTRADAVRLTELESAVAEVPGVAHCVVTEVDGSVVVTVVPERATDPAGVRAAVQDLLPESGIEVLTRPVPVLDADGRLDRRAMTAPPAPVATGHSREERLIAEVWSDLLGVPSPPLNVSFFELGGYSMAVMKLSARLQETFGLPVPVADLFEHDTISGQAKLVERLYDEQLAELSE